MFKGKAEALESIVDDIKDLSALSDEIERSREEKDKLNKTENVALKIENIIESCKQSLDFFAGFMMPEIFKHHFPLVFTQLWALLLEKIHLIRDFTKIVVGLPRGLGKTTLIKLFILYIVLFTDRHFVAIYSSREGLAENILSDVEDFLDIFNVKSVFGDWRLALETDTKQLLTFSFRGRDIIIVALGAGTSMRGMNLKNRRPDVMIFDDIQTEKCAQSEVESLALERWMVGTAMKARDNERCLYLYVGNMYPTKLCILAKLKHNPEWISFIAGAILADGTSIWEEMKPIKELYAELRSDISMGHPEIFFAEVLNDENAGRKAGIDFSKIPDVPYIEGVDLPEGKFIIIDPASGKVQGDNVEILLVEVYDRKPVCRKFVIGKDGHNKLSPGDTIKEAYKLALENNVPLIAVEDVAYQATLLYWFNVVAEQVGLQGIQIVPCSPRGKSKNSRILNTFKQLLAGEIYLHEDIRPSTYFEASQFDPTKTKNLDNKLDCIAYAQDVMEENYWSILTPLSVDQDDYGGAKALSESENCSF